MCPWLPKALNEGIALQLYSASCYGLKVYSLIKCFEALRSLQSLQLRDVMASIS